MGHSPHFYVAGTLPEFATETSIYTNTYLPASAYFMRTREEEVAEPVVPELAAPIQAEPRKVTESHAPRPGVRKPAAAGKPAAARPHFSRSSAHARDRKPAATSRPGQSASRSQNGARPNNGARPTNGMRSGQSAPKSTNGKSNGAHAATGRPNVPRQTARPHGMGNPPPLRGPRPPRRPSTRLIPTA